MSAVATEPRALTRPQYAVAHSARRLFEPSEVTLEDSILGAWEALDARTTPAECPVCRAAALTRAGCDSCGSVLT